MGAAEGREGEGERSEEEAAARQAGLDYVSDQVPGISRRRHGKGFSYKRPGGSLIRDRKERARLGALAIPPAWTEVWICPVPDGHIQATGRDDLGRKQYRYHPDWRAIRDEHKYDRMILFARALPGMRLRIEADLKKKGLPREKVLAAVVRLLEISLIRVGNAEYARQNESYGLTTMRDRHVDFSSARVRFEFRGKGGKLHQVDINDARLSTVIRQCRDVPGYELFQYLDEEGNRQDVDSSDVNDYLREIGGDEFTAKDFRTWAGTIHAAAALLECGPAEDERTGTREVNEAVKLVAERLGNTPAVSRQCYIHPDVIESYLAGSLAELLDTGGKAVRFESAVLALIDRPGRR